MYKQGIGGKEISSADSSTATISEESERGIMGELRRVVVIHERSYPATKKENDSRSHLSEARIKTDSVLWHCDACRNILWDRTLYGQFSLILCLSPRVVAINDGHVILA